MSPFDSPADSYAPSTLRPLLASPRRLLNPVSMMIRVVSVEYAQQYHLWLVGRHWPHLACSDNFQVIVLLLQVGVLRLQLEDAVEGSPQSALLLHTGQPYQNNTIYGSSTF